jgi:hypothetical protein
VAAERTGIEAAYKTGIPVAYGRFIHCAEESLRAGKTRNGILTKDNKKTIRPKGRPKPPVEYIPHRNLQERR